MIRADIAVLALKAATAFFGTHTHHVRRTIRNDLTAVLPRAVDLLDAADQSDLAAEAALARASPKKPASVKICSSASGVKAPADTDGSDNWPLTTDD